MGRYLRSCILLLTGVMRGWWRACLRARGTRRQQESLGSHPSLVKVRRVVRLLLNHIGPQELEEMDTKGGTALQRAAQGVTRRPWCSFWARGTGTQECSRGDAPYGSRCCRAHGRGAGACAASGAPSARTHGRAALHWAVIRGHEEIGRLLLIAGADAARTDSKWRTTRAVAEGEEERAACVKVFEVSERTRVGPAT
jgi:hypothetical protein